MALSPTALTSPTPRSSVLPGSISCIRLDGVVGDDVIDAVLTSDAEWLVIDARRVEEPLDDVVVTVTAAIARTRRSFDRTCILSRRRVSAGALATFASAADAFQAKVLVEAGFGPGWGGGGR